MATSGTLNATVTKWDTLRFSWSLSSQSIEDNTSTVAWKMELVTTQYGRINSTRDKDWSVTVDGKTYSGTNKIGIGNNQTKTLASGTTVIAHTADGSKTFNYTFTQEFDIEFSDEHVGSVSGSSNGVLPTIARASQPSLVTWPETTNNVGNFGETFSIHMNRASSIFTHTVRYEYGSRSDTIATGVETGTTWAVPLTFMNDIPNATSASGRIYVDTYNGSTFIGTKYTGFTVTVPASVKPTCALTLDDTTKVDEIYGSPVKGLSKIKVTVKATPAYSSPITAYAVTANGASYTEAEITTDLLKTAGTSRVTATITDSRGRTGTTYYDMTVLDYVAPVVSALSVGRCDEDGTENDQGEFCRVVFSAKVSGMSSKNTARYVLRYKQTASTTWTEVALSALNNVYTVTDHAIVFEADGNNSYDVEILVTDRHKSETRSTSVSTAFTLFNCHPSGTGWRFGGVSEEENTLQNDLALHQVGNTYAFQPSAFNGAKGFTLLATVNLTALNVNAPIVFTINRRGALCPMTVYARFASSSTSLDPDLGSFTYDGDNFGAFMVKTATSTWKLYVDNTSGWSNPCLQSWYTTENQKSRLTVTFTHEQVDGTNPNVLGTYYRAIPARMQSLLDYIYPVGSVYISYSHNNPGELFGGTWVRLTNTFLWAVDESGAIGLTGGSKTHTLTVEELPSHSHGSVYSQHAAGTKDKAWYNTSGSSVAYGAVATGGGAAHNNMPPYTQVSVWRRTA
jgi:hypothetical protein